MNARFIKDRKTNARTGTHTRKREEGREVSSMKKKERNLAEKNPLPYPRNNALSLLVIV